ncbi:MAG: type IV pili methyl-accepting chemotaxis transducer N-terminal domain-containing protein [Pseudomonadota bacterium]
MGVATHATAESLDNGATLLKPTPAQYEQDASGAAKINLSGKLRMLSQRVAASACNASAGIALDRSQAMLHDASDEFTQIVGALRFGDAALGIPDPEEDRKVQAEIKTLKDIWEPMRAQIEGAKGGEVSTELARDLAAQSAPLLEQAKLLVSRETAEHSNPADLLQADALLIDISGRQRMLAQRISKNACLAQEGDTAAIEEMNAAIETYDVSLMALRNGMAEVGILPPPTQSISDGLDEIIADWTAMKPILARVAAGESIGAEERAMIYLGANGLTGKMNVLVGEYEAASSRGL